MKQIQIKASLSELIHKKVRLVLKDGRVLEGMAVSFDDFTEDEAGREFIGLQYDTYIDGAYDEEIDEIYTEE